MDCGTRVDTRQIAVSLRKVVWPILGCVRVQCWVMSRWIVEVAKLGQYRWRRRDRRIMLITTKDDAFSRWHSED